MTSSGLQVSTLMLSLYYSGFYLHHMMSTSDVREIYNKRTSLLGCWISVNLQVKSLPVFKLPPQLSLLYIRNFLSVNIPACFLCNFYLFLLWCLTLKPYVSGASYLLWFAKFYFWTSLSLSCDWHSTLGHFPSHWQCHLFSFHYRSPERICSSIFSTFKSLLLLLSLSFIHLFPFKKHFSIWSVHLLSFYQKCVVIMKYYFLM